MSLEHCAEGESLLNYILGKLSDEQSVKIEEHMATCGNCSERLKALPSSHDPLIAVLQKLPGPLFELESECARAVDRIRILTTLDVLQSEQDPSSSP